MITIFLKTIKNNLALERYGISMSLKYLEDAKSRRSSSQYINVLLKQKKGLK